MDVNPKINEYTTPLLHNSNILIALSSLLAKCTLRTQVLTEFVQFDALDLLI